MRKRSFSLLCAMLTIAGTLQGCKDDPPGKLFEEDGVWSMVRYDLGDGSKEVNQTTRKDAFLLQFIEAENVVTAAACGMPGEDTPENSVCRLSPGMTAWTCRCFAYAYEESTMQWREFEAGTTPPHFGFEEPHAGDGGGDGSGTGGGGGEDTYVNLSTIATSSQTFTFQPLPQGVFGGDGTIHSFQFVQKTPSIFTGPAMDDNAPLIDPEGACEPCVPGM